MNYIEIDGVPQKEPDLIKWALWFGSADRIVDLTEVNGVRISTVFIGLDHRVTEGSPLLYETLVFGGSPDDLECQRYSTRAEARDGHDKLVEFYENIIDIENDSGELPS